MKTPPRLPFTPCPEPGKPNLWELLKSTKFEYRGQTITIPARYRTNFASVPRILWPLIPAMGAYWYAALVHDWLYDTKEGKALFGARNARLRTDLEFYNLMVEACPESFYRNWLMYAAVRIRGHKRWQDKTPCPTT